MSTHYSFRNYRRHVRIRRLVRVLFVVLIICLIAVTWAVSAYILGGPEDTEPVTSDATARVQEPSTEVFRTAYFQFQSGDEWAEDAGSSSQSGVYIYRAYQGSLIQQDLTIYVNPEVPAPKTTHLQPVVIGEDGLLDSVGSLDTHCKSSLPAGEKNPRQTVFQGVTMMCDSDGTIFSVLIGEEGGDGILTLARPDGGSTNFTIVYRDLQANPTGRGMSGIVRTFQAL